MFSWYTHVKPAISLWSEQVNEIIRHFIEYNKSVWLLLYWIPNNVDLNMYRWKCRNTVSLRCCFDPFTLAFRKFNLIYIQLHSMCSLVCIALDAVSDLTDLFGIDCWLIYRTEQRKMESKKSNHRSCAVLFDDNVEISKSPTPVHFLCYFFHFVWRRALAQQTTIDRIQHRRNRQKSSLWWIVNITYRAPNNSIVLIPNWL